MEKYAWASVLYYTVAVVASVVLIAAFMSNLGALRRLIAIFGYIALIISLNSWRRRRHPRSVYQVELAKRRLDSSQRPQRVLCRLAAFTSRRSLIQGLYDLTDFEWRVIEPVATQQAKRGVAC